MKKALRIYPFIALVLCSLAFVGCEDDTPTPPKSHGDSGESNIFAIIGFIVVLLFFIWILSWFVHF